MKTGDKVRAPTTLCNVYYGEDPQHECIAVEGDVGEVTVDADGKVTGVHFPDKGYWFADGFVKFQPIEDPACPSK